MKRFAISLVALVLALLILNQSARAAARTWGNTGTDYNTSGNWNAGAGPAPGVGDVGQFTAAAVTQPNISVSLSNAGLYFNGASSGGYDITGSAGVTLTLTGQSTSGSGGTANSSAAAIRSDITSGTNTIDVPVMLSPTNVPAQSTFVQASGGTLVVNGAISSLAGVNLSLRGGGAITLNGANSQSTTSIDTASEVVTLGNDSALGSGTFTVGASATLQAGGGPRTLSNAISFGGTTTFAGSNAFTINGAASTAGANSRTITVNNTNGIAFNSTFTINGNTAVGTVVFNGSANVTLNGVVQDGAFGASTLSHGGTGTLFLANSNTYTGGTLMSGGATVASINGAFGTGNVSLTANNVTLTLQGITNSIADTATLSIGLVGNTGDLVNLNFTGSETVNALTINGTNEAAGTWGGIGSGAQHEDAHFTGTGFLNVLVMIPEPATYMLIGLGTLICGQQILRRKKS